MSKLIVEMEMPASCSVCDVRYVDYMFGCGCKVFCMLRDNKEIENPDSIPSWCPIKGVLPDEHGDLIDIDVAIQTFKCIEEAPYSGFDGQEPFYTPEDVVNTLLCQDVVIAAERKDDADYQASVLMQEYIERYEPTYNSEDGSM